MLQPGEIVDGKYRVAEVIGNGGMGSVFLGENMRLGRRVAIKVLHAEVAQNKIAVERFEREAQAAARISSAHIVDVLDFGDLPTGERFMVMEYLEGESLSARLSGRGKLKPVDAAFIALQVLEGLARIHEAGIIHRDLKPANIFLTKADGRDVVKILDFGVCKVQAQGVRDVTLAGTIVGTPQYMSPEHATEGAVDARSDLYSIGVLLYRCVSGESPYPGESLTQILLKVVTEPPRPLDEVVTGIDRELIQIIEKAMAREPADRYQTATEFHATLSKWVGRVDRLLAEFLGLRHMSARVHSAASPSAVDPPVRAPLPSLDSVGGLAPTFIAEIPAEKPPPRGPMIGPSGVPRLAMDSVEEFTLTPLLDIPVPNEPSVVEALPKLSPDDAEDEEGAAPTVMKHRDDLGQPMESVASSKDPAKEEGTRRATPTGPTVPYPSPIAASERIETPRPSRSLHSLAPDLEPEDLPDAAAPSRVRLPRLLTGAAVTGGVLLACVLIFRHPPQQAEAPLPLPSPAPSATVAASVMATPAPPLASASASASPVFPVASASAAAAPSASTAAPRPPLGRPRRK